MNRLLRFEKNTSGQAMVETAIVLPLFVFMVLGTIQLTLIIQARSLTKYAAYRAARAGAMNSMDPAKMRKEAFLALTPVITGCLGCQQGRPTSASRLMMALGGETINRYLFLPVVEIRICGPLKSWLSQSVDINGARGGEEIDFDDPRNTFDQPTARELMSARGFSGGGTLQNFERTRLRVQVEYNHKLIIPFANWIFYNIWRGNRLPAVLRMGESGKDGSNSFLSLIISALLGNPDYYEMERKIGNFLFPLTGNYAFRMQSNFNRDSLPAENECIHYRNLRSK